MKKILSVLIMITISVSFLSGCASDNTPQAVGKKIDKNLTNLYTAVTNLDTIDNSYIANPDIYQIENMRAMDSKIINKNISLPKQSQAEKLSFDNNNENTLTNTEEEQKVENIEIIFEEDLDETTDMSDVLIIDENGDGTIIDSNGNVVEDNSTISDEIIKEIYIDTNNSNEMTNDEKNKVYQFLFENIRYSPRYVKDYNNINAQNSLNNYIYKVQELYTMTADVVEANNVLNNKKDILLISIDNIKSYNNKMIDGNFTPNTQQLVALDNYAQDIKNTIKRIKDSNGQLNNEVNNISTSTSSYGLSKGVDIINSNYLKILNHIDARITYFKSAMATLDQIEFIYKEAEFDKPYTPYDNNLNSISNNDSQKNINNLNNKNIDSYKENNTTNTIKSDHNLIDENNDNSKNHSNIDTFNNKLKNDKNNIINSVYDNSNSVIVTDSNNNAVNSTDTNANVAPENIINNHNLPNYTHDINAPNGTFQNGIITQNNLNHGVGNGVNGVYSGLAGSNGNIDYFKQNNFNRTDKNINTYGNNTLIDMINNGTVNNGINTLDITCSDTKPIMVDSSNINELDNLNSSSIDENLTTENNKTFTATDNDDEINIENNENNIAPDRTEKKED